MRRTFYAIFLARQLFAAGALQISPPRAFASRNRNSCCRRTTSTSSTSTSDVVVLQVEPALITGTVAVAGAAALWLSGAEERQRRAQYAEYEERESEIQAKRARLAYIEPRELWTEEELSQYDGSDPDGPILLAVDGLVFNVWKGRNFYGPGGEYHIMAGRDATRLLAKTSLKEETEADAKKPLNIAEKATLEGWLWTFKGKYDIVGRLEGYDSKP